MKLYSENKNYKLYHGSMLDMLEHIEPNSIDSVVTDPPYELNFMGKGWDNAGVSFQADTWKRCYEVLKPGGYLLAFGGSRTFHRIACAIEDAGFEIRDTIMWIYGSGFPKSMDISKQLDKRGGVSIGWFGGYLKEKLEEKGMSRTELSKHFPSKSGGLTGRVSNWINGTELPTNEQFNKIVEILDLPVDKLEEAEREVIGKGSAGLTKGNIANFSGSTEFDITLPSTNIAKQWAGWGTCLKPSFEPIIVARKPFDGTCVDNVIKWGVGGLNIDECRVPLSDNEPDKRVGTESVMHTDGEKMWYGENGYAGKDIKVYKDNGRFPANTILTYDETDYDEVCGGFPQSKGASSQNNYSNGSIYRGQSLQESSTKLEGYREWYNDDGSASRYFYCAKASKKDRNEGLDKFETKTKVFNGKSNNSSKNIKDVEKRFTTQCKNNHPTVKPTELMQYLIRLVTPNGGTILDPFNGSGSTGKAAMYENRERNKDYKYIGIELTEEYLPIAKARIEYPLNCVLHNDKKETKVTKQVVTEQNKEVSLW